MRTTLDPIALYPQSVGQDRSFRVVQGDSLRLLADLPDACVDLVFADPPYHLSNGGFTCKGGRRASVDKGAWDASQGLAADHAFQRAWLAQAQRVLKPSGTLWVSGTQHVIFSIGFALQALDFHLLNTVTWFKPNAAPNLACRTFTHSTELLIWAAPRRSKRLLHTFNYQEMKATNGGKQMRDLWNLGFEAPQAGGPQVTWSLPTPGKGEKAHGGHPTQKPISLLERVILCSSNPGDVVLDPFSGSGTTGVAAVANGRRYLGFEREAEYADLSRRRIAAALDEAGRRKVGAA
ncbi:DNA-methyltransferase [Vulgatibacter incomptus]|uniref:Methyltransferase n=1 Tax=Vulgatibacter incomptus TaxID=1391653 RepID=A0A0K1P9K7_9BACT|nr:site-specific DNA-methyltransferase [Vulgatibacter incomptus]AKU90116.1 DNA modification methyltransferase [Vulgatibacter incomptus]